MICCGGVSQIDHLDFRNESLVDEEMNTPFILLDPSCQNSVSSDECPEAGR